MRKDLNLEISLHRTGEKELEFNEFLSGVLYIFLLF